MKGDVPLGRQFNDRQIALRPSKGPTDEAKAKDACRDRLLGLMVRVAPLALLLVVLGTSWGCGAVRTVGHSTPVAPSPTRHVLANDTGDDIARSTGGEWHDHSDRTRRIGLRPCHAR